MYQVAFAMVHCAVVFELTVFEGRTSFMNLVQNYVRIVAKLLVAANDVGPLCEANFFRKVNQPPSKIDQLP